MRVQSRRVLLSRIDVLRLAPEGACVAAIGVDRFTRVRGAIGYDLAERLIASLAARAGDLVGVDNIARLAPDSLGVVFQPFDQAERSIHSVLSDLAIALEQPVDVAGVPISVHVSIGYALSTTLQPAQDQLQHAEIALDQSREQRARVVRFSAEDYGDPMRRILLMRDLRGGIDRGELRLHYQPQVDTRTGAVTGAEALVRWRHPQHGSVPPDEFIPMAEETGEIRELTDWVLDQAIMDSIVLAEAGWPIRIGVNLSGRLISDDEFADLTLERLARAQGRLTFEITETSIIHDQDRALANMKAFAEAGARIAIDDYGSGLSSLAYIQQFPAHELKIDRQFISRLTQSHKDPLLVRSSIELAHALEFDVVAEGVEDAGSLALLRMMGCDQVQGYFIGRPMPLGELFAYLDRGAGGEALSTPLRIGAIWSD